MALDPSIYFQMGQGVKSVADYDREAAAADNARLTNQSNRLALLLNTQKADEYRRGVADQNRLRDLTRSWGADTTDDQRIASLKNSGFFTQADTLEKGLLERRKAGAEVEAKGVDTRTKQYDLGRKRREHIVAGLSQFASPEDARQWLADSVMRQQVDPNDPTGFSMKDATRMMQSVPDQPEAFEKWKRDTIFSLQDAKDQAKFIAPDANTVLTNKTSAANNAATNARAAAEGAANRQVTREGHNVQLSGQQLRADLEDEKRAAAVSDDVPNKVGTLGSLGIPTGASPPWVNQTLEKDKNRVKASEAKQGAKETEKDADDAKQENVLASEAQRFLDLNKETSTGGVADQFGVVQTGKKVFSPSYGEMLSITARIAPRMRVPGSGATSDYDAKQFERATVGVDKNPVTNENIGKALIARAKLAAEYAQFRADYLEQEKHLSGSGRLWKEYINANPIFDTKGEQGSFSLNEAREDYRTFFKRKYGNKPAAKPAPAKPAAPAAPTVVTLESGTDLGDGFTVK